MRTLSRHRPSPFPSLRGDGEKAGLLSLLPLKGAGTPRRRTHIPARRSYFGSRNNHMERDYASNAGPTGAR
jgi:hypothetical protein